MPAESGCGTRVPDNGHDVRTGQGEDVRLFEALRRDMPRERPEGACKTAEASFSDATNHVYDSLRAIDKGERDFRGALVRARDALEGVSATGVA